MVLLKYKNAEKKTAIDLIKSEAQRDMDFVEPMESVGQFFFHYKRHIIIKSLTIDDIKKIAACNFDVEELESKYNMLLRSYI